MELTAVAQLRRMVLEHLARYTWEDRLIDSVYDILQEVREDTPRYRCCVYKERAVLKNRIDMALGQTCDQNIIEASKKTLRNDVDKTLPVIDVLPAACDQCPIDAYYVTDACRHCITHKCMNNCPKKAISIIQDRAFIDRTKCVECGRCKQVCPYGAIIEIHRPCVRACALGAITIGENKKAKIDHEMCVECGACRAACPFGAIDERSSIVPVIMSIKTGSKVIAMVAPSIVGQFGLKVKADQIYTALKMAGFADVVEVAIGADIVSVEEAEEYIEKVPAKQPFMTSSCCPAFVNIVKKYVPDAADKVSHTVSPMVATGRWLKEQYPDATTVFIGPCIAKKGEAKGYPEYIDYVLTFEEAMCLMEGKNIKVENVEAAEFERDGSKVGLGFPLAAGVTAAVNATVNAKGGSVRAAHYASGVDKIVTDLTAVTKGEIDCSYFEGMACSNGCIDGPGTVGDFRLTKVALSKYAEVAPVTAAVDSKYTK